MDLGLRSKAVLITGASRGIGLASAKAFAAEGARVFLIARGEEALRRAADEVLAVGAAGVQFAVEDAAGPGAPERVLAEVERAFGGLDVLVNNVGGSSGDPGADASDEDWRRVLDLNLLAAVRFCRGAHRLLAASRGAVVNVASVFGREWGGPVSYNAAKAGLIGYTKSLARVWAAEGIRANCVAPGSTLHPGGSWERRRNADPEGIARFVEREIPLGRFGTPEEIAAAIVFLASPRASLITGACLNVDGGQSRSLI
jgi:3-oxoacyl-[acyl-carrier protein] reductase